MFVFLYQLRDTLLQDTQNPAKHPYLKVYHDLLFRNGKIWMPFETPFTNLLLQEFHSSPTGGHIGVAKTFCRLHQYFDWPRILEDVHRFVSQCLVCQQTKYDTNKSAGLLQPLPIPSTI